MKRNLLIGAGGAVLAVSALAFAGWYLLLAPMRAEATVRTGAAAKALCGCVFVSGRSVDACESELGSGLAGITVEVDASAGLVSARAFPFTRALARDDGPYGCVFVPRG